MTFFLTYIQAHPTLRIASQSLWPCCGRLALSTFICHWGQWLDAFANHLVEETLKELPVLRNKYGNVCRAMDPVNRMILLQRLQKQKVNRRAVATTHGNLLPVESAWARHEDYLDGVLHTKALSQAVGNLKLCQLSVSFDPGNYGGKEVSAAVAYFPELDQAVYLLNQTVSRLLVADLDGSLVEKAKTKKLTRIEGYNELRCLAAHLDHSLGVKLTDFEVNPNLLWRELQPEEIRMKGADGRYVIYNLQTQRAAYQVPPSMKLGQVPCLTTISDQGPLNVASLSYMMYSHKSINLVALWDPYHRCWNDIKGACKRVAWCCLRRRLFSFWGRVA